MMQMPHWVVVSADLVPLDRSLIIFVFVSAVVVSFIGHLFVSREFMKRRKVEHELLSVNQRLENVLSATQTGIWEWNVQTGSLIVSAIWTEMLGFSLKELSPITIGTWRRLVQPDDLIEVDRLLERVFAKELEFYDFEVRLRHKGGHWVWIRDRGRVVAWTGEGKPLLMIGSHSDISQRRQSELDAKASEDRYRTLFTMNRDPIFLIDPKTGDILDVNESTCETYGYTHEELLLLKSTDMSSEPGKTAQAMETMVSAKTHFTTIPIRYHRRKDGTVFPVEISASQFELGERPMLLVSMRDITERLRSESQILNLSYRDELTGLYNRRFYEEELSRLDSPRNIPLSFVIGDVNGLKLVNDSLGHAMGDLLLRKVAAILRAQCRSDDIVARLGGDEFAILLPRTESTDVERLVLRVQNELSVEAVGPFDVSVAFGHATKLEPGTPFREIFTTAEDAMYRNKHLESQGRQKRTLDSIVSSLYETHRWEKSHSARVSDLAGSVAERLGCVEAEAARCRLAALMHDVGKVGIHASLLVRPDLLSEEETRQLQQHSEIGYRILKSVKEFTDVADLVRVQHERWDGRGFPSGLSGGAIPLAARIIAVTDAFDAMTAEGNDGQPGLPTTEALQGIERCAGTRFDPSVVRAFTEVVSRGSR
jgi:diguanylate cyclase (GGDEF)-like protein/PAS domain S-box-containing protein/putative nucleotidyltransferase with HDIG domain